MSSKNVATQILRVEQLLPILPPEEVNAQAQVVDYIYQPNQEEIIGSEENKDNDKTNQSEGRLIER